MGWIFCNRVCSPTRSAFLSGRLPTHINQNNACNNVTSKSVLLLDPTHVIISCDVVLEGTSGIDLRMTLLPQKLKQAGYRTAMTGLIVTRFSFDVS